MCCYVGTAATAVAGLVSAMRKCNSRLAEQKYLFFGAGSVRCNCVTYFFAKKQVEKRNRKEIVPSCTRFDVCNYNLSLASNGM